MCIEAPFAMEEEATKPDFRRSEFGSSSCCCQGCSCTDLEGGGNISKTKLTSRFDDFSAGRWDVLISASEGCDIVVDRARRRRHWPRGITEFVPELPFDLDEKKFLTNLRSSRRGAAGGPSGMTSEHLRPVLDTLQDAQLLSKMGEQLSRAQAPSSIATLGTITALQKPNGGARGIVVGDFATVGGPHDSLAVERRSGGAPFQHALSTRAGTECVAHALQSLTEENPTTTVMSIDGIGAFDLVSRKAVLQALMSIESGSAAIPFVRMFCGQASTCLWEDNEGHVHRIEQGEGGEQGDPMMPLLFALVSTLHSPPSRVLCTMKKGCWRFTTICTL